MNNFFNNAYESVLDYAESFGLDDDFDEPSTARYIARGLVGFTIIMLLAIIYYDKEPKSFQIETGVTGVAFTGSLISSAEILLNKRGGYLSNDVLPPSSLMDDIPNWEFGALTMIRDGSAALRDHFSRSQSQSIENKFLAAAEPQFNFQNDSWVLPSSEGGYQIGIDKLKLYKLDLINQKTTGTQFYARADNLVNYLLIVEKRLGSLSQRLSSSVGATRENTDLAGETGQSTENKHTLDVKTPWLEIDDVFYEARGLSFVLYHQLQAINIDFKSVLEKKNAIPSMRQIIRELKATQDPISSPMILNGRGFGFSPNYSLIMANYISRANAAVIDLRNLLEKG